MGSVCGEVLLLFHHSNTKPFSLTSKTKHIHTDCRICDPIWWQLFYSSSTSIHSIYMHRFFGPDYIVIVTDLWVCCTTKKNKNLLIKTKTKKKICDEKYDHFRHFQFHRRISIPFREKQLLFSILLTAFHDKEKIYIFFFFSLKPYHI